MMNPRFFIGLLLFFCFSCVCEASFSEGFQAFLKKQYGTKVAKQLTRLDLGVNGSLGGSMSAKPIRIFRNALVIVHGLTNDAASMSNISNFFQQKGYGMNELYATSYGPNGTKIGMADAITCDYVKQVRQLLIAVYEYTMKPVDAAAYSLGAPVLRKAILGDRCVDNGEYIGKPLTSKIRSFMSTAGANFGAMECVGNEGVPICNQKNGLSIGSKFINDINSRQRYEGQRIFMIRSSTDEVVGYNVSGLMVSSVPHALVNVTISNFTHTDTVFNSLNIQYSLISSGHVPQLALDKDTNAESELTASKCSGRVTGDDNEFYNGDEEEDQDEGYEGTGEYDVKNKRYKFPSGWYYYHTASQKGQFFKN